MTVEWIEDPSAFEWPQWTSLVDADPEATVFHTPGYLKPYWEQFGVGRLRVARVRRSGRDIAAGAFELQDDVLTWLGGFEVTDYMGPAALPDQRPGAAQELMAAVAARDDWTRADLAGLPGDGRWLADLAGAADSAGLAVREATDGVAPFLELPDSYEGYLDGLPGKPRHELRRKARRLRETFPDARVVDATAATVTEDLDRFVQLHRSSAGEKGRFMVADMERFFHRLATELLPQGTFRLSFLEAGGRRLAGAVGFRFRDRFLLYNSAYDHALAGLAPGIVLVTELISDAIEEGRRGLDLLKGDLGYKYRFGARPRQVSRLVLDRR